MNRTGTRDEAAPEALLGRGPSRAEGDVQERRAERGPPSEAPGEERHGALALAGRHDVQKVANALGVSHRPDSLRVLLHLVRHPANS